MQPLGPGATAFVAVHLQHDIVGDGGAFTPIFEAEMTRNGTLEKAATLLELARRSGAHVVYARIGFDADYADMVANVPLLSIAKDAGALKNGTQQTQIVEAVAPTDGDTVLTHTRTSPFAGSPLDAMLRARGVSNVVVLGVATNASVEDAARWAANLGYRSIIASDASSAATQAAHDATLESFGLFGEVATTAELESALGTEAQR